MKSLLGRSILVLPDLEAAAWAASEEWNSAMAGGTADQPRRVLLAGGSTPRRLYEMLADARVAPREWWSAIECFFGDERCVPPDHPDSNYGLVRRALLAPLGESAPRVHRMRGEDPDPAAAARDYERLLRERFGGPSPKIPSFDLALLGLGADGHTASLFPGADSAPGASRLVISTTRPDDGTPRLTVTFTLLNAAKRVLFLVCGAEKAEAVARALAPDRKTSPAEPPEAIPAGRVRPASGEAVWVLDQAAARLLGA